MEIHEGFSAYPTYPGARTDGYNKYDLEQWATKLQFRLTLLIQKHNKYFENEAFE